jgi:hypothetical protein
LARFSEPFTPSNTPLAGVKSDLGLEALADAARPTLVANWTESDWRLACTWMFFQSM